MISRRQPMSIWALALAVAVLALGAGIAGAQTRFGLSPEAYAGYQRWVLAMCIGGDERTLTAELRRFAAELAPAFAQAVIEGPTDEDLRVVNAAAETRYAQRASFPFEQFRSSGVSKQDLDRFRRVSRADYVNDEVRRFTQGYRANAVAALGVIGGPVSRELLARMAENRTDPLAAAAREALRARPE